MTEQNITETNGNEVSVVESTGDQPVMVQDTKGAALANMIEKLMCDPSIDIGRLDKVLDFQERIMDKQAAQEFNKDRALFQSQIPPIKKSKMNNHTKTKYSTIDDIHAAVLPVASKHGFSISYRNEQAEKDNHMRVTAVLTHSGGHKEENTVEIPKDTSGNKSNVHSIGSSLSYAERYAIKGLLALTYEGEDDDGVTIELISHEQAVDIDNRIRALSDGKEYKPKFLSYMKAGSLQNILAKDFSKADTALTSKEKA